METAIKKELIPTKEQEKIIETNEDILINSAAGAGKTAVMKMYINSRPEKCSVLYLAFNKSVKEEGERRFKDIDHCFVDVKTAHGLAYGAIVVPNRYKVGFLNAEDIMKEFDITDYILAVHIIKIITLYCTTIEKDIEKLDYISSLTNEKSIEYAEKNYEDIVKYGSLGLKAMKSGKLPMIHDYYLKLYQLSKPVLKYDYILFDEGQDASETMLEIFLSQENAVKVIVGDTHQQIYSWRGAVNSLEKVNYKSFDLSESFRFPQHIADKAMYAINWKKIIKNRPENFKIIGSGTGNHITKSKAVLARTNIKLIDYIIQNVVIGKAYTKIFFEGGFQNYNISNIWMYVNDVLALKMGQPHRIKNKRLKHLKDMGELNLFIEETEDITLKQGVEMIEKYGKNLPEYLDKIKDLEVKYKEDAQIIFSSVHKAKGAEYDDVTLLDDFPDYDKLEKMIKKCPVKYRDLTIQLINEEINILYVAITRSKGKLSIPGIINRDL